MSSCCHAGPCEDLFGHDWAQRDMETYLRSGLGNIESHMLEALTLAAPVLSGTRVLEIGGGVGAMQAELLRRGAATGEVIEIVGAYAPFALRLAHQVGVADKTSFRIHDVLSQPDAVDRADFVVMNKVVCCSSVGPALAATAARLTTCALVLSLPRYNWFTRAVAMLQRALFRALGRSYRAYVWPHESIAAAAVSGGLELQQSGGGALWRYMLFVRRSS
ncbi:MAG: hypothetical protein KF813_04515 [Trueperaceae bacterium]|nr:hypothetical protein [Trueperaceae bacterium]